MKKESIPILRENIPVNTNQNQIVNTMPEVYLREIQLKQWRNINNENLVFSRGENLIIGKNAQGKTSLLEAIAVLAAGRSFRTTRLDEAISWEGETTFLRGVFCVQGQNDVIEIGISGQKKEIRINGKSVSRFSQLLGRVPIVEIIPSDFAIIDGDPSTRRKFLDYYISLWDKVYYRKLLDYNRALRQRNAELLSKERDIELRHWDELIIQSGIYCIEKRREFSERLVEYFRRIYQDIASEDPAVNLVYESCLDLDESENQSDRVDQYKDAFHNALRLDKMTGTTSVGPHREDIAILIGNRIAKKYASQGQKRSAVIALKMALGPFFKYQTQVEPIFLVDDVFNELDGYRKKGLEKALSARQSFVAATTLDGIGMRLQDQACYMVNGGKYVPRKENL